MGSNKKLYGYYPLLDKFLPIRVDSNGKVVISGSIIRLRVYLSSSQTGILTGIWTKVLLNAESYDVGGNFANYKFTVPITGYYLVAAAVMYWNVVPDREYEISIYKNNVSILYNKFHSATIYWLSAVCTDIVYLNEGDYLELFVKASPGGGDYSADLLTGGTASADTEYDASYLAGLACDNNVATRWQTTISALPHWWKYDFGNGVAWNIEKLTIKTFDGGTGVYFKDFILQGSNNNVNWTDIYTGQVANNTNVQTFTFVNAVSYRYYRVYSTSGWSSGYPAVISVSEFEMMTLSVLDSTVYGNSETTFLSVSLL